MAVTDTTKNTVPMHRYERREDYAYAHGHLCFISTKAATKMYDLLDSGKSHDSKISLTGLLKK